MTMRQFRRDADADEGDEYRCQRDGMLGLGAGARSYTRGLHYSTPWKMVARNIRGVVEDYVARMRAGDTRVSHGFALDEDERAAPVRHPVAAVRRARLADFAEDSARRRGFADEFAALAAEGLIARGRRLDPPDAAGRASTPTSWGSCSSPSACRRLIADFEYDT